MILFNNEILLKDEDELDSFIQALNEEIFSDESRTGIEILIKYMCDCYEAGERLKAMTHDKISQDIIPVVCINFDMCEDLNQIKFMIMSSEDRELTLREEMLFNSLCDICFGQIRGLYTRFCAEA